MYEFYISIIMPMYNVAKYFNECMSTLINQSIGFEHIQLIIVDDASTDESLHMAQEYEKKYDNISIYSCDVNSGAAGKPRNIGLMHVKSPYVMFLDPDDTLYEQACEKLWKSISEIDADMVSGFYSLMNQDGEVYQYNVYNELPEHRYYLENQFEDILKIKNSFINKIYKYSIIERNQLKFPEGIPGQDTVFFYEYLLNCKDVYYIPEPIFKYRIRNKYDKSISNNLTKNFFEGIEKCFSLVKDVFRTEKKEWFLKSIENVDEYYLGLLIASGLCEEEIKSIMSQWRWIYLENCDYGNDKLYVPIIYDVLLREDYDLVACIIIHLRNIHKKINDLYEGTLWLKQQLECKEQRIGELEETKNFFEEQNANKDKTIEQQKKAYQEQEKANKFFKEQNANKNKEIEQLDKTIEQQEIAYHELEKAKKFFEEQSTNKDKVLEQQKAAYQELYEAKEWNAEQSANKDIVIENLKNELERIRKDG